MATKPSRPAVPRTLAELQTVSDYRTARPGAEALVPIRERNEVSLQIQDQYGKIEESGERTRASRSRTEPSGFH